MSNFRYLDAMRKPLMAILFSAAVLEAQVPLELLGSDQRGLVEDIVRRADFHFQTRTEPKKVQVATMERLFDHPRLGAAMWRSCRFVPGFHVFQFSDGTWSMSDMRGLTGTMQLLAKRPGLRIYMVDGRAERGRLKAPFAVGAKMVTVYRYWQGPKGFESVLETWTALDSALLGALSRPFRPYIRGRQDEFIAYINGNVALFGEFASANPAEFLSPLRREGDPVALRDFDAVFGKK